ncbi:uncharacterized protein [Procambarus clarkii]|uniref:uncharacterized protein n=1 Tax=Procambarus clarkii TaxID=6728 RepID=UPI003743F027
MAQVRSPWVHLTLCVLCACVCIVCVQADTRSDRANPETLPDLQAIAELNESITLKKHSPKPMHTTDGLEEEEEQPQGPESPSYPSKARKEWPGGLSSQSDVAAASPVKETASKRNISSLGRGVTAQELKSATSLAGNLLLLLISVVIAGSLFVMLLCFIHKWKENMGTARYPRVVYSMLRQSEDEPEDVLGEILINIGLAAPEDSRPLTPSSSETSDSPDPSDHEVNITDLDGSKFTTIPLRSDEAAKRLMAPEPDESDEELLQ